MNRLFKHAVMVTAMLAAASFVACDDDDDNNGGNEGPVIPYAGEYAGTYVCSAPGADGAYTQIAQDNIAFTATEKAVTIPNFPLKNLIEALGQQGIIPENLLPALQSLTVSYTLGIGTVSEADGVYTAPTSTPAIILMDNTVTVTLSSPAPMTYTESKSEMQFHMTIDSVVVGEKEPTPLGFKFDITGTKKQS